MCSRRSRASPTLRSFSVTVPLTAARRAVRPALPPSKLLQHAQKLIGAGAQFPAVTHRYTVLCHEDRHVG